MKSQIFKTKCKLPEKIFVSLLGVSLVFLTAKILLNSPINLQTVITYSSLVFLFISLSFLAYYDLKKLEVHRKVSFILMGILLIINIGIFLLERNSPQIIINHSYVYDSYQNIMGALALGSLFQLIVLVTKEKGLGQGDVRIALITGLLLGFNNLLSWGYITVFGALIYGFVLSAIKHKKIKGLKIPLVPFMVLGIITLLLLNL